MKTQDAISLFGSIKALAKALGITQPAIYQWGDNVPELRAFQIREIVATRDPQQTKEAA
jgi:DNA-binding transcriptional regulator YdaS (Cro superfamily)